jgi:hypothetical protein
MSPDPYYGSYDFSNPQSFNRYAYVENDPLSYIDPIGLVLCDYGTNEDGSEEYGDEETDDDCIQSDGTVVEVGATVIVNGDGSGGDFVVLEGPAIYIPIDSSQWSAPNNAECDNACQLAHAFNKTGVYSLTSVCFPVAFYGASGTIAFSGVAAGGGYAGAESAEVITSTMKVPAVIWTNLGLSTVGAWFHKEIGSAVDSFCSHH